MSSGLTLPISLYLLTLSTPVQVVGELMGALWGLLKPNAPLGFKVGLWLVSV